MRILAMPLTILVIALVIYLVITAMRGPSHAERTKAVRQAEWTKAVRQAEWKTATEMKDGNTIVVVRQVAEVRGATVELARQVIAEIPDAAPDWEQRYHEAMAEARSRASALQIESD